MTSLSFVFVFSVSILSLYIAVSFSLVYIAVPAAISFGIMSSLCCIQAPGAGSPAISIMVTWQPFAFNVWAVSSPVSPEPIRAIFLFFGVTFPDSTSSAVHTALSL